MEFWVQHIEKSTEQGAEPTETDRESLVIAQRGQGLLETGSI